ncbi:hypothetical protein D9M68_932150 [compost metagenome]
MARAAPPPRAYTPSISWMAMPAILATTPSATVVAPRPSLPACLTCVAGAAGAGAWDLVTSAGVLAWVWVVKTITPGHLIRAPRWCRHQ